MERDKWLSQFNIPDENALAEIRRLVGQLTPADFPKRHRRKLKDATATGSIDLILDLVTTTLQKDYVETRQETEEDGYMFDYVLMKMDNDPSELQILTRLFHTDKEGNIFYGRHIWCIGDNSYVVWIDD